MNAPRVSVIIPVYNGEAHLARAVESVLAQTFAAYELMIVDDGSRDQSLAMARDWAARFPDRITVLHHPGGVNRGVAASRNLAAGKARGEFVAFLDVDDAWTPGKLAKQVAFMDERPRLGLSITGARIVREGAGHLFIPGAEVLGDRPPRSRRTALIQILACQVNFIFSTVMVRTECLKAVDGFDEHLPYQSEDRILVAMVVADHGIALVPAVLCDYLAHGESYTASVVRRGLAGAIFFDLQIRVIRWLRAHSHANWARYAAYRLAPDALVWAATGSWHPATLARLLGNLLALGMLYPAVLPSLPIHLLRHSRLGPRLGMKKRTRHAPKAEHTNGGDPA